MARGRRRRRPSRKADAPGWVWMICGLAVGLSVALYIHIRNLAEQRGSEPQTVERTAETKTTTAEPSQNQDTDGFSFYELLPRFEVIIPDHDGRARPDVTPAAVEEPGQYVLQAGSFSTFADADRRKAQLALFGIESRIQRVTIDDDEWHRVRIGPITDLTELNDIRDTLRNAEIEVLLIRADN